MDKSYYKKIIFPRQKILDFNEKTIHWASVVRTPTQQHKYFLLQKQETFQKMAVSIYPVYFATQVALQLFEYRWEMQPSK